MSKSQDENGIQGREKRVGIKTLLKLLPFGKKEKKII
jgi:hypothetical protein